METFGFTQKKFLSLSEAGQHKHIIAWLSRIYQDLTTNRSAERQLKNFYKQYDQILNWMGKSCPMPPKSSASRDWLIYVSDAVHSHRVLIDLPLRDQDLLNRVMTNDRCDPISERPDMNYQIALDGLRSLFNVGSIFRTCDAAGVSTLILGNCKGKDDPRVKKTAMGAQDSITEEHTRDLAQTLMDKKAAGFRIIGLETIKDTVSCHNYSWPQNAVIVVGNEEYGISPHVLACLDDTVHIPMFGKKNSLNVANALSTVLYQAVFSRMETAKL
ncbi:MAG: hypothetical protein MI892_21650 [Desulfobacterales bacterium]|nr:hypothetical protein [Desulfobacterales bacterium]